MIANYPESTQNQREWLKRYLSHFDEISPSQRWSCQRYMGIPAEAYDAVVAEIETERKHAHGAGRAGSAVELTGRAFSRRP
jgi:hypothetical protein